MRKRIIATAISVFVIVFFTVKQVMLCRFTEYYVFFLIPYILSNTATLIMLLLSLKNKPKEINDSNGMFIVCLIVANFPLAIALFGTNLSGSQINEKIRTLASYLAIGAIPFYFFAVINLGRNLSVLPEANALKTSGIYSFSRHPLYSTYIYWYITQIFILQSWIIVVLSIMQITLQIIRAKNEEKILQRNFPAYGTYKKQVWWVGKNVFSK